MRQKRSLSQTDVSSTRSKTVYTDTQLDVNEIERELLSRDSNLPGTSTCDFIGPQAYSSKAHERRSKLKSALIARKRKSLAQRRPVSCDSARPRKRQCHRKNSRQQPSKPTPPSLVIGQWKDDDAVPGPSALTSTLPSSSSSRPRDGNENAPRTGSRLWDRRRIIRRPATKTKSRSTLMRRYRSSFANRQRLPSYPRRLFSDPQSSRYCVTPSPGFNRKPPSDNCSFNHSASSTSSRKPFLRWPSPRRVRSWTPSPSTSTPSSSSSSTPSQSPPPQAPRRRSRTVIRRSTSTFSTPSRRPRRKRNSYSYSYSPARVSATTARRRTASVRRRYKKQNRPRHRLKSRDRSSPEASHRDRHRYSPDSASRPKSVKTRSRTSSSSRSRPGHIANEKRRRTRTRSPRAVDTRRPRHRRRRSTSRRQARSYPNPGPERRKQDRLFEFYEGDDAEEEDQEQEEKDKAKDRKKQKIGLSNKANSKQMQMLEEENINSENRRYFCRLM